jgi:hypothetical protein
MAEREQFTALELTRAEAYQLHAEVTLIDVDIKFLFISHYDRPPTPDVAAFAIEHDAATTFKGSATALEAAGLLLGRIAKSGLPQLPGDAKKVEALWSEDSASIRVILGKVDYWREPERRATS